MPQIFQSYVNCIQCANTTLIMNLEEKSNTTPVPVKLKWSARLRHTDVSIQGDTIERTTVTNDNCSVSILAEIQGAVDSAKQWQVKIQGSEDIYLGLSLLNPSSVNRLNYQGLGGPGSGFYLIKSRGDTYSNIKGGQYKKGLSFGSGDIIKCVLDLKNCLFVLVKNQTDKFDFKIHPQTSENDKYLFCVFLYRIGNKVTFC